MTWFKVDDGFSDNAKVHALQESKHWKGAIALWTLAGSWCSKQETDGFVPELTVRRLGGTPQEAEALIECGLWERAEKGYLFHQWGERNPLKAELQAKREQNRERVAKHRGKPSSNGGGNAPSNGGSNALHDPPVTDPRPVPSRPVPTDPPLAPQGAAASEPSRAPEPARLMHELENAIGSEFFKRNKPHQGAAPSQRLEACKRAQSATDMGHFPRAVDAVTALAAAAVAEACKPNGKLGLALIQVDFTPQAKPTSEPNPFGPMRDGA